MWTLVFTFPRFLFLQTPSLFPHLNFQQTPLLNPLWKPTTDIMMMKSSSTPPRDSESSTHPESPHSPLRFHSPLRSDLGDPDTPPYSSPSASPEHHNNSTTTTTTTTAIAKLETHFSPHPSPPQPVVNNYKHRRDDVNPNEDAKAKLQDHQAPVPPYPTLATAAAAAAPVVVMNRGMRGEGLAPVMMVPRARGVGTGMVKNSRTRERLKRFALCFRVCEVVLCMIAFSVMAADKTEGWSGDSYDRYKEYRYCLSVNVIAFVYSVFQVCDLAYNLMTGKRASLDHLHSYFDFFMDQILAYLLISASSSAATRVDDWKANWGKDKFTDMASAAVAMSFLAFGVFSISSLISGYILCSYDLA